VSGRMAGWNWLFNSRKWHYFEKDGRALCRRFLILGSNLDAKQGGDDSPDNCAGCRKALLAKRTKETAA
jgi:hypothetical protein